jgi:phospholipase C
LRRRVLIAVVLALVAISAVSYAFVRNREQAQVILPPDYRARTLSGDQTRWPIKHVIFILKENRTYDQLFGTFPAGNGATTANDHGKIIPLNRGHYEIPVKLPHHYKDEVRDVDGGKMDGFGRGPKWDPFTFSQMYQDQIPNYWALARHFVLGDNFFASGDGPSFPNHLFSIAAQSAGTHDIPPNAGRTKEGAKTWGCDSPPDEYVVVQDPDGDRSKVPPCFDIPTEADLLTVAGINWSFYAATAAQNGYIWSSYNAIRHVRETNQWQKHVHPVDDLISDIEGDRLPPVTWVTPRFKDSDHPESKTNLCVGENWTTQVLNAVQQSSMWKDTAVFLSWDDWGGFYDHLPPRRFDDFGLGIRVPLLVISPWVKGGTIDHRLGEFSSILRFIEDNWGLSQLTHRDKQANDLVHNFDFQQTPVQPLILPRRQCVADLAPLPPGVGPTPTPSGSPSSSSSSSDGGD